MADYAVLPIGNGPGQYAEAGTSVGITTGFPGGKGSTRPSNRDSAKPQQDGDPRRSALTSAFQNYSALLESGHSANSAKAKLVAMLVKTGKFTPQEAAHLVDEAALGHPVQPTPTHIAAGVPGGLMPFVGDNGGTKEAAPSSGAAPTGLSPGLSSMGFGPNSTNPNMPNINPPPPPMTGPLSPNQPDATGQSQAVRDALKLEQDSQLQRDKDQMSGKKVSMKPPSLHELLGTLLLNQYKDQDRKAPALRIV